MVNGMFGPRVRRVAVGALAIACLGVGVASADDGGSAAPPQVDYFNPADPVFAAALRRAQADRPPSGAAAEAAREESRDAFADATNAEAVELARDTFGEALTGAINVASDLPRGLRVADYRSDTTAQVVTATGKPAGLLLSETPLTTDATGDTPIDLKLVERGDGFVAQQPRVEVTLPDRADEPATLADTGVAFAPVGADDTAAVEKSDRLLYPEAATDTDYVLQATALGAEASGSCAAPTARPSCGCTTTCPPAPR